MQWKVNSTSKWVNNEWRERILWSCWVDIYLTLSLTFIQPASLWTHWATLRCHPYLLRATASAFSQVSPSLCGSFLSVFVRWIFTAVTFRHIFMRCVHANACQVPGWILSALNRHRPPITTIGWYLDVWCKKNTNASRRQEFFRRWTVSLELPACCVT